MSAPSLERTKPLRRMNKAQREWCENYERETGFDPLMDDFLHGNESFVEAARKSVRWFENWSSDAFLNISRHVPGTH